MIQPTRLMIILVCIVFLITSGCVSQSPPKNVTSTLNDIFSAPIGGFVHPEKNTIQDPNTTFESDYVFYSRDWSGEVKYSVSGKYKGQISNESSVLYVEPSTFTAKPNHVYTAKVYLNSSGLPQDFFIPQPEWLKPDIGFSYSPYFLYFNVSLDGTDSLFCNDNIHLQSFYDKPYPPVDEIAIEDGSLSLKKGESKNFTITYSPDWNTGLYEISYSFSKTPLNVTITPSHFIARHDLRYTVDVNVTAGSHLVPGQYPVSFTEKGGVNEIMIRCDKCNASDPRKQMFVVNVTVE
jgi:hypothetical protein